MATYDWTGLGLADGTVLSNANLNTAGNGSGTLVYQALSGGATRVTKQETNGNGVEITSTTAGGLARLDTATISGGAECMAIDFIYQAPAAPVTDHNYLVVGRNANATPASSGHVVHTTGGVIEFRNASNTSGGVTSSVSGSATTGATPALVTGDYYRISFAIIINTSTTPTTSNGRFLGRVRSISAPGTWNSGAEFWIDTGYTANATADKTNLFRTGRAATAGTVNTFRYLNLRWRDLTTPDTSTTKTNAISNFVQDAAPTVSTAGEGTFWLIYNVATPASGGAITYTITQTAGTTTSPTSVTAGVWKVVQDTAGALTYSVTAAESGGGSVTTTHTVPAAVTLVSGQYRERIRVSGAWV